MTDAHAHGQLAHFPYTANKGDTLRRQLAAFLEERGDQPRDLREREQGVCTQR